ncbi:MAG: hypothetical protein AAF939_21765 [Planctomycetota bacterium]
MSESNADGHSNWNEYLLKALDSEANRSIGQFVHLHGQAFAPNSLPKGVGVGKFGVCFANAYRMLKRHGSSKGLIYVEGYAVSSTSGQAHLHAWCVNKERVVFDSTWRNANSYFGIPFKTDYVQEVISQRERKGDLYFGLLDDWKSGFPLISKLGNLEAIWKEEL